MGLNQLYYLFQHQFLFYYFHFLFAEVLQFFLYHLVLNLYNGETILVEPKLCSIEDFNQRMTSGADLSLEITAPSVLSLQPHPGFLLQDGSSPCKWHWVDSADSNHTHYKYKPPGSEATLLRTSVHARFLNCADCQ